MNDTDVLHCKRGARINEDAEEFADNPYDQ